MSWITCFGRHWNRQLTDWWSSEVLVADINRRRVDLSEQAGVYVLHDAALTPVYVGQAGRGQPGLGNRLRQHCSDQLWGAWHYYSWFGIHPMTVDQAVDRSDRVWQADKVTLLDETEAILIYFLAPRMNRKAGTFENAVEYQQWFHDGMGQFSPFPVYERLKEIETRMDRLEAASRDATTRAEPDTEAEIPGTSGQPQDDA
ncbi:MAG: GIY-YIG nuclease family protein [Verrucomicrobiales bacterium]|nr:GIY-YIG nuclease family protein [Verrucomicrobiales bacterium]